MRREGVLVLCLYCIALIITHAAPSQDCPVCDHKLDTELGGDVTERRSVSVSADVVASWTVWEEKKWKVA